MSENRSIETSKAPAPVGLYPHARQVGELLFLSGIGPRKPVTGEIPGLEMTAQGNWKVFDAEAQIRSVFDNVKIVLDESGSSWEKLVDVTVFLTDMKRDFELYNKIYAEYFGSNKPCRTTVEVKSLPTPIIIELKCIATV